MQITLNNVGFIKNATVRLTGLNVIAGPNGTGKSTVGKTVYSIIKSISDSTKTLFEDRKALVESMCKSLFFSIQANLQRSDPKTRNHDVKILLDNFTSPFAGELVKLLKISDYTDAQHHIIEHINLIDAFLTLDDKSKLSAKKSLNDLKSVFIDISEKEEIKHSIEYMYKKIFRCQVNNLNTHATSKVIVDNNDETLLEYEISNNASVLPFSERLTIKTNENLKQRIWPEVTFFETPLVLQAANSDNLPYYWEDLIEKLKTNIQKSESRLCTDVYSSLAELLRGELVYITDKQDFFFVPMNTENNLFVNNMASGEKMFGILQKLAKYGYISSEHLLIFDEPENHLHPQWQVKLAELLVTLLENDVPLLLTTHSSTFISALQDFAYAKDLQEKVHFYFADPKTCIIKDVNNYAEKEDVIFKSFYDAKELLPDM